MNKIDLKQIKILRVFRFISYLVFILFLILNVKGSFQHPSYHFLHVDERQVVDSIFNVFQINDEFDRFIGVSNKLLQLTFTILAELVIGGNLEFGRLWNNFYILFAGPFFFVGPEVSIIVERILQNIIFYFTTLYFVIHFTDKKYKWLFLIISFGLPGLSYVISTPKPDPFMLMFLVFSLKSFIIDKKLFKGFFLLGISIGIKIIALIPGLIIGVYLILPLKVINSFEKFYKSIFCTVIGVIIAQPALLTLNFKIYKRMYLAISSSSKYNQQKFFNFNLSTFDSWVSNISSFYSVNKIFIYTLLLLLTIELLLNFYNNKNIYESVLLFSGLVTTLFLVINVQRAWTYYLVLPLFLIVMYFGMTINNLSSLVSKITIFSFIFLQTLGIFKFYEQSSNDYFTVNKSWEQNMYLALDFIDEQYTENSFKFNKVYWDTEFYFPRKGVTYFSNFDVVENWEVDFGLQPLNDRVDFIVTKNSYSHTIDIKSIKIGDLNIYYQDK